MGMAFQGRGRAKLKPLCQKQVMCKARKKTYLRGAQSVNKYLLGVHCVSWLQAVCVANYNAGQDRREIRLAGSKQLADIRRQYVKGVTWCGFNYTLVLFAMKQRDNALVSFSF